MDEVFESPDDGDSVSPVTYPFVYTPALAGTAHDGLVSDLVPAERAFEVFMGRRYDPSEASGGGLLEQGIVVPSRDVREVNAVAAALQAGAPARLAAGGAVSGAPPRLVRGAAETPLQRYHRLAEEVAALQRDLAAAGEAGDARPAGAAPLRPDAGVWAQLAAGTAALARQLGGLEGALAAAAAGQAARAAAAPPAGGSAAAAVAAALAAPGEPPAAAPAAAAAAARPALDAAGVVALDARLAALERAVGGGCPPAGCPPGGCGRLACRLAAAEAALARLQPADVEAVAARARAAAPALRALGAAWEALPPGAAAPGPNGGPYVLAAARAADAAARVGRLEALAAGVPALAARLATLAGVHAAACGHVRRLAAVEAAAAAAEQSLAADRAVLAEVHAGLRAAGEAVAANAAAVDARLRALGK
jgi:hypothetical protein